MDQFKFDDNQPGRRARSSGAFNWCGKMLRSPSDNAIGRRLAAESQVSIERRRASARIDKAYTEPSKAHRKASDYVLANVSHTAIMTIDELADAVGVSPATAKRLAHALDSTVTLYTYIEQLS